MGAVVHPPKGSTLTSIAWAGVVFVVMATVFDVLVAAQVAGRAGVVAAAPEAALALPFAVMGALIVSQRPHSRIGWLLTAIAASAGIDGTLNSYAAASIWLGGGSWPATVWTAWAGRWTPVVPAVLILVILPLIYPTGRLLSRAWRSIPWLAVLLAALFVIGTVIVDQAVRVTVHDVVGVSISPSPTAIEGSDAIGEVLAVGSFSAFVCVVAVAMWSLRVRYHRASGIERLQIRWLLLGVLPIVIVIAGLFVVPPGIRSNELMFGDTAVVIALWAFPIAVGGAVLRHHLFDIDRLISRTISYTLLTGILASVYAAGIVISQQFVSPAIGGSSIAVAVTTLAVAALFTPLRRWLRAVMDRQFNRSRYNAPATTEAFRARLQSEVDLATVTATLLATIDKAVQPAHTGVWLRAPQQK